MSCICRKALPDVREIFVRLSRMSGSGREVRPDVREWSGGPPVYPGVVGRPS